MKILFYAPLKPFSHPTPSGDREIARGLHQFFLDQGHEVEVLSEFRTPRFYQNWRGWLGFMKSLPEALEKAIRFKPDVVFTYHMYYKAPDPLGPICALALSKPYFIFEGMYSVRPRTQPEYLPGYLMSAGALKTVSHVFTDKTDDIAGLKKILKDDQVTYMQPSIDLEYFTANSESRKKLRAEWKADFAPVITCIAMLRADRKTDGVRFLIECLSEMKKEGVEFQAHFVGGGPCENEISELIQKELGAFGVFHGPQEKSEILSILNASDLFAFPGIDEGFGLVYTEAQAMSLPVVAFDNGGIPDAVDNNESGFLTPLMNKDEYKKALMKLIESPTLRREMGEKGRKRVEAKNDRNKNYKKMLEIMKRYLRSPASDK